MSTPMRNNIVLGVDPGFDRVGVAILEKEKVLFSDCIETNRKLPHQKRLLQIGEGIRKIISKWQPQELAIESLFFNQNITNGIRVAEARGIVIYESAKAGLDVYEYSPQAVKVGVTGYGKADKKQMEAMIKKLVKLPKQSSKRLDDEVDAIALGITHLASKRTAS